ncbi:MAG: DUF4852 domain-containing protein [Alphaproteobacteria bacterium]
MKKVFILLLALLLASPAQASDYAEPTWPNLVRTLIRFGAINVNDDRLLDQFAIITECALYKAMYRDDFQWNKVRGVMRDSIRANVATYPTNYRYEAELQLGKYDFKEKLYRLTDKTTVRNVNSLLLFQAYRNVCGDANIRDIPDYFRAILDTPVTFEGLPLNEKDAEVMVKQMREGKNTDLIVYTRFNLRIVYIDPLTKALKSKDADSYVQGTMRNGHQIRLDVHLDSMDFFSDKEMTKLIYTYQP